jgi:hypothetical protein
VIGHFFKSFHHTILRRSWVNIVVQCTNPVPSIPAPWIDSHCQTHSPHRSARSRWCRRTRARRRSPAQRAATPRCTRSQRPERTLTVRAVSRSEATGVTCQSTLGNIRSTLGNIRSTSGIKSTSGDSSQREKWSCRYRNAVWENSAVKQNGIAPLNKRNDTGPHRYTVGNPDTAVQDFRLDCRCPSRRDGLPRQVHYPAAPLYGTLPVVVSDDRHTCARPMCVSKGF